MQLLLLAVLCLAVAWGPPPAARAQVSHSPLYQRPPERPALPLAHPRLARSPAANAHAPEQARCQLQHTLAKDHTIQRSRPPPACMRPQLPGAAQPPLPPTRRPTPRLRAGAPGVCGPWRLRRDLGDLPSRCAAPGGQRRGGAGGHSGRHAPPRGSTRLAAAAAACGGGWWARPAAAGAAAAAPRPVRPRDAGRRQERGAVWQ